MKSNSVFFFLEDKLCRSLLLLLLYLSFISFVVLESHKLDGPSESESH